MVRIMLLGMAFLFLTQSDIYAGEEMKDCCRILELRQYNLVRDQRDTLIRLFDTHFIEPQEATGMFLVGQFQDRNNPDRFVWIRGFNDMESREKALRTFYMESPVWKEHRTAANETMIDVNNVLLLRPSNETSGFRLNRSERPPLDGPSTDGGLIVATIYYFSNLVPSAFVRSFESEFIPMMKEWKAPLLAYLVTETGKNNFPALPVREDARVFVWFTSFANEADYDSFRKKMGAGRASELLIQNNVKSTEVLELLPTHRSLLRHSTK